MIRLGFLREARIRVRVSPSGDLFWHGHLAPHLGELVQAIYDLEPAEGGIVVELDASQRLRPGEVPVPAADGPDAIAFVIELAAHEVERLADTLLQAVVRWIGRRRKTSKSVHVTIYGPNGEELRRVKV